MGCKQSTPLKEETPVAVASPVNVASPNRAARAASPMKEAVHEEAPVVEEESVEAAEPVAAPVEVVVEETPAPVVVEEAPVAPVAEEKTPAKRRAKSVRAKKQKEAPAPAAAKPEPFARAAMNDENAIVSSFKKDAKETEAADEKRVAFAPRALAKSNVTPSAKKGKMSKKDAEAQRVKEMTIAFQRLLTHADHLENHLATRNTYTQKA